MIRLNGAFVRKQTRRTRAATNEAAQQQQDAQLHKFKRGFGAGMTDQSNCLILSVISAKAGIQVKPNLNQLPELFEKLLFLNFFSSLYL